MSSLHIESFESPGNEGILAKTDAGPGASFLTVDFNVKELARQAGMGDLVLSREPGLDFNCSVSNIFWEQH